MDMKVLAVGDVVGGPGMERIRRSLRYLKRQTGADFGVYYSYLIRIEELLWTFVCFA